jgi:hypothetical protein
MYDELVTTARQYGNGDLLVGLFYMKVNRHEFTAEQLQVFDRFMADGARMMAPVDTLED